jgi:F-type H+-transporting ATPase subunit b
MYRIVATLTVVYALLLPSRLAADDKPQESTPAPEVAAGAEVDELTEGQSPAGSTHGAALEHATEGAAEKSGGAATDVHGTAGADQGDAGHEPHGGGGGHDATDLSHMNASRQLNDPSQFKSDLAIWTCVVFLCLLLILGKFAWGPVTEGLDRREQAIAAMIEEAKLGQEKAAQQLKQYEAKLAAAGEEARELVAQARKDADAAKDRILAEAQTAADRQRERAVEDIQVAKNVALQEITRTSVDLAVNLAGRIVRQQLRAEDHSQLIREAMDQLPSRN